MSSPPPEELSQEVAPTEQLASELGPGSRLGKYRISKRLGEGGMGVVFAAVHEKLGRSVAIKVLRRDLCNSQEQLQRFQREAELVTRIGHRNIVAVYDFGRIGDGSLYYVMEVLSGESMRDRLARGPLSDRELSAIFTQLLSSVKAAHEVGAVHRDLKPDNVMLVPTEPGEPPLVKLLDFGVAKIRGEQADSPEAQKQLAPGDMSSDSLATAAGAIMGTPAYMSPEQIKGAGKVDQRADIYAIGVMLFEALIGKRPFEGASFGELMGQHLFDDPPVPSVAHTKEELPPRKLHWDKLDAIVLKTLAKKPEERYPDCGALLSDLEGVLTATRYKSITALPDLERMEAAQSEANRVARKKRLVQRVIGGALTVTLAGAGIALLRRTRSSSEVRHIDLGKARARAAALIAPKRADVNGLPDLMNAVALTRSRPLAPVVEDALGSEKSVVWRAAVQAAGRICQSQDEALRTALASVAEEAVGAEAVDVASARLSCGDPAAKTALLAMANAPALDDVARLRAALALATAGQLSAGALRTAFASALRGGSVPSELRRSVLTQLLLMKDLEAQRQVDEAAARTGPEDQGDAHQRRIEALQAKALAHQPKAGDFLYSAASRSGGDEHVELALTLAEANDAWAPKLVRPLLNDPSPKLRARALAALGWVAQNTKWPQEPGGFLAIVEPFLGDKDPQVALTAAVLLADADTVAATTPAAAKEAAAVPEKASEKASSSEAP